MRERKKMPRKRKTASPEIVSVSTFDELVSYVNKINPYENTIVLCGWWNTINNDNGKLEIKVLQFKKVPVSVLGKDGF